MAPSNEVVPTINNEYAVAVTGFNPKRYTRTGTPNIDPPPPKSPRTKPIKTAPIYPSIISKGNYLLMRHL